jgi:drug/metabolite transporter (DMT)-like permease
MHRLLPLAFLISVFSIFGISWIVIDVDPDTAPWYFFVILIGLIFLFVFNFLGTLLYFLRTRFIKNYNKGWYVKTSFKMAFFIALFVALLAALSILQLVTTLTLFASITIVVLLAIWVYLGRK